jgi:hypothetical protein
MITQSEYAKAIYGAGVAEREQDDRHHDISATGQFVRDKVLAGLATLDFKATHKPNGPLLGCVKTGKVGPKPAKIADAALKVHGSSGIGQVTIVFVGEAHDSAVDQSRATDLISKIGDNPSFSDCVLVVERGMSYAIPQTHSRIREENVSSISGFEFGKEKLEHDNRTIVVAGYLLAWCACGDQRRSTLFFVFFGDRHADLADQFEYLVKAGSRYGIDWVEKRPRSYCYVPSQG